MNLFYYRLYKISQLIITIEKIVLYIIFQEAFDAL